MAISVATFRYDGNDVQPVRPTVASRAWSPKSSAGAGGSASTQRAAAWPQSY
jgi:hypothetical protein